MKKSMRIIMLSITVLSILALILLSGTDYDPTAGFHVTINSALVEQQTEDVTVIIDDSSQRAVFLNADGNCVKMLTTGTKSQKVTYYSALSITEDAVYIAEYTRFANSAYVETESLVRYSLDGTEEATLFTYTHTMGDDRTLDPFLQDVTVSGDRGSALLLDVLGEHCYLYQFDTDSENLTVSLKDQAVTQLPDAFTEGLTVLSVFDTQNPERIIVRSSGNKFAYTDLKNAGEPFTAAESELPCADVLTLTLDDNGEVVAGSTCEHEGETLGLDGRTIAVYVLYWACCLWLALFVISAVVVALRSERKKKEYKKFRTLLLGSAAVLICGFIAVFYSVNLVNNGYEVSDDSLRGYATVLYASAKDDLNDCLTEFRETGELDVEQQESMERILEENSRLLADEDQDVTFVLIARDADGNLYRLGDSVMRTMAGSYMGNSNELYPDMNQTDDWLVSGSVQDQWIQTNIAAVRFFDQTGSETGLLVCQTDSQVLLSSVWSSSLSLFIRLLSIMITAGFLFTEVREWLKGLQKNRLLKQEHYAHPEVAFTHSIAFVAVVAASVNSILLSVIVNEMVKSAGLPANGFYISLPIVLYSIGFLLGSSVRAFLVRHLNQKLVLLTGAAVAALGYALCYYCIVTANLFLFAAAVLITTTAVGIVHSFSMDLSFHAKNDAERVALNRSVSTAVIAGSSIAGTLTGYLAKQFGNATIEFLGVAFCIGLFLLILFVIPKGKEVRETDHREKENSGGGLLKEIGRFLKDGQTLSILLLMSLPVEIVYGYKSYLFPLLATDAGMDQSLVSSIVVFCTAAIFYSAPLISWMEKKLGPNRIMIFAAVIMSLAMILFVYNRTMGWSVITLAAIIMGIKMIEPAVISSWQKRAMENRVEHSAASFTATFFKYCGESARSPIFVSVWNAVGINLTCCLTGVVFLSCTGLFGLLNMLYCSRTKTNVGGKPHP